jgi:hypothetical protein
MSARRSTRTSLQSDWGGNEPDSHARPTSLVTPVTICAPPVVSRIHSPDLGSKPTERGDADGAIATIMRSEGITSDHLGATPGGDG